MQVDTSLEIEKLKQNQPVEIQHLLNQCQDYATQKLYHQLTITLIKLIQIPQIKVLLIPLYNFIKHFELKLKEIYLVEICCVISKDFKSVQESIEFLSSLYDKLKERNFKEKSKDSKDKGSKEDLLTPGLVLCKLEIAHYNLLLNTPQSSLLTYATLKQVESHLTEETKASYYKVLADYYKSKADYTNYYKNSLLFVSTNSLSEESSWFLKMSEEEMKLRAFDLCVGLVLSPDLYNFSELYNHEIVKFLDKNYFNLLECFCFGDLEKFKIVTAKEYLNDLFNKNLPFIREKICVVKLCYLCFGKRELSFDEICREVCVGIGEVEILVMKGFSLGLIDGKIDQVRGVVLIDFVQPRVFSKKDVSSLEGMVFDWEKKLDKLVTEMVR